MPVVAQAGDDAATAVARTYREFGRLEARGRSAAYEALAESVAGDSALVSFIASLPPPKRQPNLLFAAARYLLGAPPSIGPLRELASQSPAELSQVILARRTQTNEPARCDPPAVYRGDMLTDLPSLVAQAPADATLVIYHTSALWYLPAEQREQFASTARGLGATWLASEPPGVVPGTDGPARDGHTCVLARDGDVIALTESHGTWLRWLP